MGWTLTAPTDDESTLSDLFGFHLPSIEDASAACSIRRAEPYPATSYVVLHGIDEPESSRVRHRDVDFFLGRNYLVPSTTGSRAASGACGRCAISTSGS